MSLQVSAVMLGVEDVDRAKAFYVDGLGGEIEQDFPGFATVRLGGGSKLALYGWDAVAQDAGVPGEGSGFRGVSLHFISDSREEVDRVMTAAGAAGATVLRAATATDWGGYDGHFADPDGHIWKITTVAG